MKTMGGEMGVSQLMENRLVYVYKNGKTKRKK